MADAQNGPLFAGFLKILPVFIMVFPGILAYALFSEQIENPNDTLMVLISQVLPSGLIGLMTAALLAEVILTALFLFIILGATSNGAPAGFAPIAIGLGLTLIHLISIPITNTSVNPARSTGVALFAEGPALAQLWLFWVAPLIGGALGGLLWKTIGSDD